MRAITTATIALVGVMSPLSAQTPSGISPAALPSMPKAEVIKVTLQPKATPTRCSSISHCRGTRIEPRAMPPFFAARRW